MELRDFYQQLCYHYVSLFVSYFYKYPGLIFLSFLFASIFFSLILFFITHTMSDLYLEPYVEIISRNKSREFVEPFVEISSRTRSREGNLLIWHK